MSITTARPLAFMPKRADEQAFIAAGFIVEDGRGSHWLVTAAHAPSRRQATSDFASWRSPVRLFNDQSQSVELTLFQNINGTKHPLFKTFTDNAGVMTDMMALPLASQIINAAKIDRSSIIKLPDVIERQQGLGPITGYGFPYKSGMWPYYPADEITGQLLDTSGMGYRATLSTTEGHSGGPAFAADGSFAGMMIGSTDGVAIVISDRMLCAFINDRLRPKWPI